MITHQHDDYEEEEEEDDADERVAWMLPGKQAPVVAAAERLWRCFC